MEVKRSRLKQIIKEEMEYVNRLFEGNLADQVYEDSTGRRGTVLSQTLCESGTATHYDVEFDDEIKLNLPAEELTVITEKIQENFLSSLFGKDKSSRRSKHRVVGNVRNLEKALDNVELTRGAASLPWLPSIPRKHEFEEMIAKDPGLERKIKKGYQVMQNYWNTFPDREKEFSTRSGHGYGAGASGSGGDEILFRVRRALGRERDKYEDWEAEVLVRADQILSRWKNNLDQLKALMG